MHADEWPVLIAVLIAAAWDIRCRRIPNWLVLPFLAAGFVAVGLEHGLAGVGTGVAGMAVAVAALGPFCWLRAMGMGDLKLCAAIGVWLGPSQMVLALVLTGIAGGVLAAGWALCHRALGRSADGVGQLLGGWLRGKRGVTLDTPGTLSIPYAPAIAAGTIFVLLARQQ